ncbi:hypothetical protein SD71_05620 [Cohnella kolymensis]|uniref:Cell shape determination protein CcmA n=1 Tax=Cohnella kolymensis TaxID=1590652 RepID=A0ABR5A874_9BACL|nr:polymer-forming cytoskeletal protein [Cohnella kolymensis]KIL36873.1 hypothetical protein SD71_05620 [Cohnella kolymensis]
MFKGKKTKFDPNMTDTLIGEGSVFEGKIKSEAGIRVEGRIIGDIESAGDVTVGENGDARSNIKARNVILAGRITGNITAKGKLTIKASGQLHGNLSALELSIETGGVFQGSSKMETKASSAAADSANGQTDLESGAAATSDDGTASVLKTW